MTKMNLQNILHNTFISWECLISFNSVCKDAQKCQTDRKKLEQTCLTLITLIKGIEMSVEQLIAGLYVVINEYESIICVFC